MEKVTVQQVDNHLAIMRAALEALEQQANPLLAAINALKREIVAESNVTSIMIHTADTNREHDDLQKDNCELRRRIRS